MSFYSLEEKAMLAQVPRLKFRQGFSKSFLFLCQGAGEGAGLQISWTHVASVILLYFSPQWGLPLRTWVPRPNCLKKILTCFLKWLFRSVSCCFRISSIRWHFLPSSKWLRIFFFSSCPGFGEWCGQNGERVRTSCDSRLTDLSEGAPSNQAKGQIQITVTLSFIKGKAFQRQVAVNFFITT